MLTFQVGNTTFHFLPLIISLLVIFAVFAFSVILRVIHINSMKKLCAAGEYERSISYAEKLLKFFTRSNKLFRNKNSQRTIEDLHIWLAIDYLGLSKYDLFWEHINKVGGREDVKNSWIAACYILQKDLEKAKEFLEKIEQTEPMKNTLALLNGAILCEQGNADEGKQMIESVLPKLNLALSRKIALNYLA